MDAVKVADQSAGDAMIDTANKVAAIKERKAKEAAAAQIAASQRAAAADRNAANQHPTGGYGGYGPGMYGGYVPGTNPYMGRQHGGPVSAGRVYRVGEAGPETFVPSQSGRIEPNGSRGGTVDPRIIARAIKDALEGTSMNVDGRQLGRLTVRHQPLAVAELGGRR